MPDPVVGIAVAKSLGVTGPDADKVASGLLTRVFGPSADAIGEALARYTMYRLRNVGKIVERADLKSSGGRNNGIVNPRVAHMLLENGSYCDDEVMADYLGGVLAGSRTPRGRDDRAAAWSDVITSMSALQIRAHYLLYRTWSVRLRGMSSDVIDLGDGNDRLRATMHAELGEFTCALVYDNEVDPGDALIHAISGLVRVGLLEDNVSFGSRSDRNGPNSQFEELLCAMPTVIGLELYGWAQGLPGLTPTDFLAKAVPFDLHDTITSLTAVEFLLLPHV